MVFSSECIPSKNSHNMWLFFDVAVFDVAVFDGAVFDGAVFDVCEFSCDMKFIN